MGSTTSAIDAHLRDDIAASATDLATLKTLVRDALSMLATDDALLAGWQDLLTSCNKDAPPIESVCVRHDTFWALTELTGRVPQELSRAVTDVLSGDSWALHEARVVLGETLQSPSSPKSSKPPAPGALGALSDPKERLEVAKKLLTIPPRTVHHVIWLAYDNAGLTSTVQSIGPVTFYEAMHSARFSRMRTLTAATYPLSSRRRRCRSWFLMGRTSSWPASIWEPTAALTPPAAPTIWSTRWPRTLPHEPAAVCGRSSAGTSTSKTAGSCEL